MTGQKYTRNARSAFKRVMDKIKSANTNGVDASVATNGDADGDGTADGDDEGDKKPKKAAAKKKAPAKPKEVKTATAPNEKKRTRNAKSKAEKPSKKAKKEEPVEEEGDLDAAHDDFYIKGEHSDDDAQAAEQLNEDGKSFLNLSSCVDEVPFEEYMMAESAKTANNDDSAEDY
jgi:hypothetical protein